MCVYTVKTQIFVVILNTVRMTFFVLHFWNDYRHLDII